MLLLVDVWEKSYSRFMAFAKTKSAFGGFEQPHLRHMMAEQVAMDTVWYEEAREQPQAHLSRLQGMASGIERWQAYI